MAPLASNNPAPTAAASSSTKVARKNPNAFQSGSHSATFCTGQGRASVMARGVERGESVALDRGAALAVVVIQITLCRRGEQAAEMVEAMAVMAANCGIKGDGHISGVGFVRKRGQQNLALLERLDHRVNQL